MKSIGSLVLVIIQYIYAAGNQAKRNEPQGQCRIFIRMEKLSCQEKRDEQKQVLHPV
jgi:hypothetical protein